MVSPFIAFRANGHLNKVRHAATGVALMAACWLAVAPAQAENMITVEADRAKVVSIAGSPSAVIVGNPTYADVSVRNGQIVIHGRHFGSTNIIVLDADGNQLANLEVAVERRRPGAVVIYKAGMKNSYNCSPNCESVLEVGDAPGYFEDLVQKQMNNKSVVAQSAAKLSE